MAGTASRNSFTLGVATPGPADDRDPFGEPCPIHDSIFQAVPALETFATWFERQYDTALHADFHATLTDAMLVLRTAEMMIRMKRRCDTLAPQEPAPAAAIAAAPQQSAASAAATHAAPEISSDTGTPLEFY